MPSASKRPPAKRAASQRGSSAPRAPRAQPTARLLNLGEKSSAWLASVGISDEATLRAVGPVEAFRRVQAAYPRQVSWVLLYALHGALARTHWNAFPPELKAQMRAKVAQADERGPSKTP